MGSAAKRRRMGSKAGVSMDSSRARVRAGSRNPHSASKGVSAQISSGLGESSLNDRSELVRGRPRPSSRAHPARAALAPGWVCNDRGRAAARTLTMNGSRPKRAAASDPKAATGSAATAWSSGVPASPTRAGPWGWAPNHSSAQGRSEAGRSSRSGMAVRDPHS